MAGTVVRRRFTSTLTAALALVLGIAVASVAGGTTDDENGDGMSDAKAAALSSESEYYAGLSEDEKKQNEAKLAAKSDDALQTWIKGTLQHSRTTF